MATARGRSLLGLSSDDGGGPSPPPEAEWSTVKTARGVHLQQARGENGDTWYRVREVQKVQGAQAPVTVRGPTQTAIQMDDRGNVTLASGKTPAQQHAEDVQAAALDAGATPGQAAALARRAASEGQGGGGAMGGTAVKVIAVAAALAAAWWFSR